MWILQFSSSRGATWVSHLELPHIFPWLEIAAAWFPSEPLVRIKSKSSASFLPRIPVLSSLGKTLPQFTTGFLWVRLLRAVSIFFTYMLKDCPSALESLPGSFLRFIGLTIPSQGRPHTIVTYVKDIGCCWLTSN